MNPSESEPLRARQEAPLGAPGSPGPVPATALWISAAIAASLAVYTLWAVWPLLRLRADLLMWSETDMVGNIIKLATGRPIYTPPSDNNAFVYTPGASLLTWALARVLGLALDVANLRTLQLVFVTLAAALATHNATLLARLAGVAAAPRPRMAWRLLSFSLLWLAATSPYVNKHVLALHTDACALLASMVAFWAALRYLESPTRLRLLAMAATPAIGFFFKQLLAAWAGALTLVVALREPRAVKRWAGFALLSAGGVAAVVALCYGVWGDAFLFWTFGIMGGRSVSIAGAHGISLLRGVDHLLRAWSELVPGVVGGFALLRGANRARLGPLWVAWAALVGSETLTSGDGWGVLYYFGPGAVIGLCWLLAALPSILATRDDESRVASEERWQALRSGAACIAGTLVIALALRVVPSRDPGAARFFPPPGVPADVLRYVQAIEAETKGPRLERILVDWGNWIYLPDRVLMRDRAVSLADQPFAGIYRNFDGLLERIRSRYYDKILVQDLHAPTFLYDWAGWSRSSGVRAVLLENYREERLIPAATVDGRPVEAVKLTGAVSVLVPKAPV